MPTFGKVLCYYFIEVSTWHHTRELPYWCGGCQSTKTEEEAKAVILALFFRTTEAAQPLSCAHSVHSVHARGDYTGGKTSVDY